MQVSACILKAVCRMLACSVSSHLMVTAEKKKGRPSRFRLPKSASEQADEAVPSSTKYKNKWALKIFRE